MSKKCKVTSVLDDSLIDNIELIEVFVDEVALPKYISKVVQDLNSLFPMPELVHLKRVKAGEILLFPVGNIQEENVQTVLQTKGFQKDLLKNRIRKVKVPATPPVVRQQYVKCHSIWPCNFHPDKYLEKLYTNTLFNDVDLEKINTFMKISKEIGSFSKSPGKNCGVVIVDPRIDSIVAVGYDRTIEGPCRHAVMVAIDNVAKTQDGGAWINIQENSELIERDLNISGIPTDVSSMLKNKYSEIKIGARIYKPKSGDPEGPYLCTGLHVYTSCEPCVMCAMALIHSRAKRVFYGTRCEKGALGSLCKIHTVKDLNHHYEVFVVENEKK